MGGGWVSSNGNFFLSLVPDWLFMWLVGGGLVTFDVKFPLGFLSGWFILLVMGGGWVSWVDTNGNFSLGLVPGWLVLLVGDWAGLMVGWMIERLIDFLVD